MEGRAVGIVLVLILGACTRLAHGQALTVDYFAVGVIAYELIVGRRPYKGRDRKSIREEMLAKEARLPYSFKAVSQ